jgi:hypothetical protein
MNAHLRRRNTLVPLLTLLGAGFVVSLGLGTAGGDAEGVPTPSETSIEVTATPVSPEVVDTLVVAAEMTPTGTTVPAEP